MSDTSTLVRPDALPIDPRMQERLLAVRREEGRRRLRWVAGAGGVALLIVLGIGVLRSPLFIVHHVRVSGGVHTSEADVLRVTGLGRRPLMVDLNSRRVDDQLKALPWVASAQVKRQWPTTVAIHLTERAPVALVGAVGGQVALVDGSGRVLTVSPAAAPGGVAGPGQAASALPTIRDIAPAGGPGSALSGPGVSDALAMAAALPAALTADQRSQIQAIAGGDANLRLIMLPNRTVSFGNADQLAAKLLALRTLLERVNVKDIATIDVRVPDAPILTRLGTPSTVSTIPRG
jgi:cell division protein FtsQ